MKKILCFGALVVLMGNVVSAAEGRVFRSLPSAMVTTGLLGQTSASTVPALSPTPDPVYTPGVESTIVQTRAVDGPSVPSPTPSVLPIIPAPATRTLVPQPEYSPAAPLELYPDVRYRGLRNVAPCAVPTIIQVPNPCIKDRCLRNCVNVQVCVPPCDPAQVRVTRDGSRVRYDYGKYAVLVRTVGDRIVVSYDD